MHAGVSEPHTGREIHQHDAQRHLNPVLQPGRGAARVLCSPEDPCGGRGRHCPLPLHQGQPGEIPLPLCMYDIHRASAAMRRSSVVLPMESNTVQPSTLCTKLAVMERMHV